MLLQWQDYASRVVVVNYGKKLTALLPLDIKTAEAGIEIFRLGGNV